MAELNQLAAMLSMIPFNNLNQFQDVQNGDDNMDNASFNDMEVAVSNQKLYDIVKKLNLSNNHNNLMVMMIQFFASEVYPYGIKGARLQEGHFYQFINLVFENVYNRAPKFKVEITDQAVRNMDIVIEKAKLIDPHLCCDINYLFDNHDGTTYFVDAYKYLKEEIEVDKFTNTDEKNVGMLSSTGCEPTETVEDQCLAEELIEPCCAGCYSSGGIGDVYHAPVINFNAPVINFGTDTNVTINNVRDILNDFYIHHADENKSEDEDCE